MNLLEKQVAAVKARKAAATAPAKFRRITPEEEITVPCVLAHYDESGMPWAIVIYGEQAAERLRDRYTHCLPIQWPEVRE